MAQPAPAEFAEFVREVTIRALDRMADRMKELAKEQRGVVRAWSRLAPADKQGLLNEVLAAALATAPEPGDENTEQPRRPRDIRRYDPEEVATTLPARTPKIRKKSAKTKPAEGG